MSEEQDSLKKGEMLQMMSKFKNISINFSYHEKRIFNFCFVYIFFAAYVVSEIVRCTAQSIDGMLEVIAQITYLLFCPTIYMILLYKAQKYNSKNCDSLNYYKMQFQGEDKLQYVKSTTAPQVAKSIAIPLIVVVTVSFGYFIDIERCIAIYETIRTDIIGKDPIGIIIGIYGLVIALFQGLKKELDKKCMFFSVDDLPIIKKCGRQIAISIVIMLVYIISFFMASYMDGDIRRLYLIELIWFGCFAYILWGCIYMFYKQVDIEKKVLKKIDRYYGTEKILMLPQRIWYRGTAIIKLTDLLNKYKKITCKIDLDKIEEVEFACIISDKHSNRKRAVLKYYLVSICFLLVLGAVVYILTNTMSEAVCATYRWVMLIGFLPAMLLWLSPKMIAQNYQFINWMTYISLWGYYVKLKGKKWERYVSSYGLIYSPYQKFLLELKRIICFYNLAIKMRYNDEEDFGECGIDDICAYITDMHQREEKVEFMVIPLLVCACIYETRDKRVNHNFEETLERISVKKEIKEKIINLCMLILRDIHGDDRTFKEQMYKEKLSSFLV